MNLLSSSEIIFLAAVKKIAQKNENANKDAICKILKIDEEDLKNNLQV